MPLVVAVLIAAAAVDKIVTAIGAKAPIVAGMLTAAAGFAMATRMTADTGYGYTATCLAVIGLGAGLALAPAVDAVMATLPEHRTAAGSGLLMAIRQIGAAFAIAVLGTLLNTAYTRILDPHLDQLPDPAAATSRDTVIGAYTAARQLPDVEGQALVDAAANAYAHAMSSVFWASAGLSAALAVLIAARLPGRSGPK